MFNKIFVNKKIHSVFLGKMSNLEDSRVTNKKIFTHKDDAGFEDITFNKGFVEIKNSYNDSLSEGIFMGLIDSNYNIEDLEKLDVWAPFYGLKKDKNNKISLFIMNNIVHTLMMNSSIVWKFDKGFNNDTFTVSNIIVYGNIINGFGRCVFISPNNYFKLIVGTSLDFRGEFKNGNLINGFIFFDHQDKNLFPAQSSFMDNFMLHIQVLNGDLIFKPYLRDGIKRILDIDNNVILSREQINEKSPYYGLTNVSYMMELTKVPNEPEMVEIINEELIKDIKNNKTKFKLYELEDFLIEYELTILFGDFKFKIIEDLKKSKKK